MIDIKEVKDGIILTVKVKPNSTKFSIELNDNIIIKCKSPPKQNKANIEIIKELGKLFNQKVEILTGLTSKNKRILIHNITEKEFRRIACKT